MSTPETFADAAIAEAMAYLEQDNITKRMKEAWSSYVADNASDSQKRGLHGADLKAAILRAMESCEHYLYVMFTSEGSYRGWTIEHAQYWQGNGGPSAAIPLGPCSLDDIERAIDDNCGAELEEIGETTETKE